MADRCYDEETESSCNGRSRWGCQWTTDCGDDDEPTDPPTPHPVHSPVETEHPVHSPTDPPVHTPTDPPTTKSPTPPPVADVGCCYGANENMRLYMNCYDLEDDEFTCLRYVSRWGCGWMDGVSECVPPTPEPGCCAKGDPTNWQAWRCEDATESVCQQFAGRADCEWRTGDDPRLCADPTTQPTPSPIPTPQPSVRPTTAPVPSIPPTRAPFEGQSSCPTNHRHRKSWAESSAQERALYVSGFKQLADSGVVQKFTETHLDSSEHSNAAFLPWHREYIYLMENAIRALGGQYECFTLPYWDWSSEPTPHDVQDGATLFITDSGLGGDGNGQCLLDEDGDDDPIWGDGAYTVYVTSDRFSSGDCLIRDLDYPEETGVCAFYSPSQLMDLIDQSSQYKFFRPYLEGTPHGLPHVCIGGDAYGDMATYFSPNDPIFYLHHCFVDYLYAIWQDCNDYDGATINSNSNGYDKSVTADLDFDALEPDGISPGPKQIADTFDIVADFDVSYEKGDFWVNAEVDATGNCASGNINDDWFYDDESSSELEEEYKGQKRSRRGSLSVSAAIWKNLREKYPDAPTRGLVAEWAEEVCFYEQQQADIDCPVPDELPDCSSFPVDPESNDIVVSLDEMLAFNLSDCQISTRQSMYNWADIMSQKRFLCEGCYDPICGLRGIMDVGRCLFDSMEHDDDDELTASAVSTDSVKALLVTARDGVQSNMAVLVLVAAAVLILAAKRWRDATATTSKGKGAETEMAPKRRSSSTATAAARAYGAVY